MDRIFGTPKEPIFNHKDIGMSPDLLQEWLITLLNCNFEQIQSSHVDQIKDDERNIPINFELLRSKVKDKLSQTLIKYQHFGSDVITHLVYKGIFRAGCATETIFLTCEKLKTAPDAKYAAAEIFDSFMFKHIRDLHQHVQKSASRQKRRDWDAIIGRVKNQLTLRIVSCCQIASKLTSHYKVVSVTRAKKYLSELGHKYASDAILQSEIRILKTLDFNVSPASTLVYVETILEILGHNCPGIEVKMYHDVSLHVLDLVYLQYNQVYGLLFQVTLRKEKPSEKEKQAFKNVRSDKLLLAVSVIASAVHIAEQHKTDKIVEQLSQITRIPMDDIVDLASVIIQQLDSDDSQSSGSVSINTQECNY